MAQRCLHVLQFVKEFLMQQVPLVMKFHSRSKAKKLKRDMCELIAHVLFQLYVLSKLSTCLLYPLHIISKIFCKFVSSARMTSLNFNCFRNSPSDRVQHIHVTETQMVRVLNILCCLLLFRVCLHTPMTESVTPVNIHFYESR